METGCNFPYVNPTYIYSIILGVSHHYRLALEFLILDNELLTLADESVILNDEILILDNESVILNDEVLILDNESLIAALEIPRLDDEFLILKAESLILALEIPRLNDQFLFKSDGKWTIAQDLLFDTKAEYSLGVIVAEDAVGVCLLTYLAELL